MRIFRFLPSLLALFASLPAAAVTDGPAPSCPVTLLDGSRTLDPSRFKGKVVYLDFWASWCGPCASSFAFMNRLHGDLKAKGLELIAVDLDEEPADAEAFLEKHPAEFTVAADPEGKCPTLYGAKGMPASYLIDRHGNIRHVHLGFRHGDGEAVRKQVEALLSER